MEKKLKKKNYLKKKNEIKWFARRKPQKKMSMTKHNMHHNIYLPVRYKY